jgi:transcriptional regulator with XRE-family HTH domain
MSTIQARMPAAASEPPRTVTCPRGPTVPRLMLGTRLQRLRLAAGISTDLAGDAIRASRSKISRMENGRVGLKVRDVSDLLDLYGITNEKERAGMLALARESGGHGWWSGFDDVMTDWLQEYIGLEAAASLIRTFELQFVHGLLQTEAYARAVTLLCYPNASRDEIDRRVDLRLRRQERIADDGPPRVWSVIDEGALRRPVGGAAVMRGQLQRLLELAELRKVTIQVVPFARGAHAAAGGAFTLLRFTEPDVPDIVYLEHLTGAQCLDKRADIDRYAETMNKLNVAALPPAETRDFLAQVLRET